MMVCGQDHFHIVENYAAAVRAHDARAAPPGRGQDLVLKSLADIELLGKEDPLPANLPPLSDVPTLCYTPGTTGDPKRVVLLHSNLAIVGVLAHERLAIDPTDVHLSYLPPQHVFERVEHAALLCNGAGIGFYQGDVLFHIEDLAKLVSTIFVSVSRLYNREYDKMSKNVAAAGRLKMLLFDQAYATKNAALSDGAKMRASRAAGTWTFTCQSMAKKP